METPRPDYYVVKTLGCKANLYDSQLIEAELQKRGWRPLPEVNAVPGLCIVNSCTVTDEADRQSRKLASKLSRDNPGARVVVTGCGAEVDPERLARSKGIHYVVGNQDKPRMIDLILAKLREEKLAGSSPESAAESGGLVLGSVLQYGELVSRHPMDREWPLPDRSFATPPVHLEGNSDKTRAFLKIQEGCNAFCTYCIIPYGRGPSRSLKADEVVAQARELTAQGIREIVVTGTNIGDYGIDWGMNPNDALADLFARMLDESGLERLRVGSLDPTEITPSLLRLMERDGRFCPHFHVSLQAAHGRILKLMKRKYGLAQVRETLARIAEMPGTPIGGAFTGMDVITGFPGETDAEFEESYEELARLPWSRLHVFPYSERAGTPATRLPGAVASQVRTDRARQLGELSLSRVRAHAERALAESLRLARPLEGVLLEMPSQRPPAGLSEELAARLALPASPQYWVNGYTSNYLRVYMPVTESQAAGLRNQLVSAEPVGVVVDRVQGAASLVGRIVAG